MAVLQFSSTCNSKADGRNLGYFTSILTFVIFSNPRMSFKLIYLPVHPSPFFCITIEFFSKSFAKGVKFSLAPSPNFQPVSEPMKLQAQGKRSNKNLS